MREIKFRGKSLDSGEWLYGDLIHYEWEPGQPYPYIQTGMERNEHGIMQTRGGRVNPSTIGQYTGWTDKDGKEIYEGDIVEFVYVDYPVCEVVFDNGSFMHREIGEDVSLVQLRYNLCVEIIGNIHDNSELLKGGNNK